MKTSFLTALMLAGGLVQAEPFDGHQHDILDLKGQSVEVAEIEQKEWNGLKTVVSNGHLRVTKRYHVRGGDTVIGPGASLSVGPDAHLATGAGDARTRRIDLAPGAKLRFEVRDWSMDHTKITVPKGAEWFADVGRFVLAGAMKDNEWRIAGKATLLRGVNVAECKYGNKLKIVVEPSGELWLGGPVKDVTVELKGGKVFLFWDGDFAPDVLQLAGGSEKDVTRVKKLPKDFPARYTFRVETDDNNRCYYISADHFKESIKELGFRYPNPDAQSETSSFYVYLADGDGEYVDYEDTGDSDGYYIDDDYHVDISSFEGCWYYDGDLSADRYILIDAYGEWFYYARNEGDAEASEIDCGDLRIAEGETSTYYADSDWYSNVSYRVFEFDTGVLTWDEEGVFYRME